VHSLSTSKALRAPLAKNNPILIVIKLTDTMSRSFRWMSYADAHAYESEARREGVSAVARGPGGFMRKYQSHGSALRNLPYSSTYTWGQRRRDFIKRHLPQYEAHPTHRRWLAMTMWAYRAPRRHASSSPVR
tara:strand:- start:1129 stop:1524 length:396 start_codon:yes stop_codon:yes gene_type:complete